MYGYKIMTDILVSLQGFFGFLGKTEPFEALNPCRLRDVTAITP